MRAIPVALALSLLGATAHADRTEPEAPEAEPEHHHHHENHLAVFAGATTGLGDMSETAVTVGADYERRLTFIDHRLGVGALADFAFGTETETLMAGFVAFHPIEGLMILGGAGVAMVGAGDHSAFAVRANAAYFVELGGFSVGPAVSFDHANGESALVYGLAAGKGF